MLSRTAGEVLFHPSRAFAGMRVERALPGAVVYATIMFVLGIVATAAWTPAAVVLLSYWSGAEGVGTVWVAEMAILLLLGLSWLPGIVCTILIRATVAHGLLRLLSGNIRPLEATVAAIAFADGSAAAWLLLPVAGFVVGPVWAALVETVGLAKVHNIGRGRALTAVLTSHLVLLSAGAALIIAIVAAAAALQTLLPA